MRSQWPLCFCSQPWQQAQQCTVLACHVFFYRLTGGLVVTMLETVTHTKHTRPPPIICENFIVSALWSLECPLTAGKIVGSLQTNFAAENFRSNGGCKSTVRRRSRAGTCPTLHHCTALSDQLRVAGDDCAQG